MTEKLSTWYSEMCVWGGKKQNYSLSVDEKELQ